MKQFIFTLIGIALTSTAVASKSGSIETRIVGGQAVEAGQYRFTVSLQDDQGHFCGGALINPTTVLTAGHCVSWAPPTHVLIGTNDLDQPHQGETIEVIGHLVHPNYNDSPVPSHDFAILYLAHPATQAPVEISTEFLHEESFPSDRELTVAGWGLLQEDNYQLPNLLQSVDVPVVTREACEAQFQRARPASHNYLDETMFCAGFEVGQKDACQGDSGGPIFIENEDGETVLLGVVSWGLGCARENLSGVYSDVGWAYDWIQANLLYRLPETTITLAAE